MSDEEIWRAARDGDDRAFAELFDMHQARVVRHAAHLVVEPSQVEDVAAVAFLELWRRRDNVRVVEGSILPWLLVTTTNVARNANRALRRYETLLRSLPRDLTDEPDVSEIVSMSLSPAQIIRLHEAVASLNQRDAALLTLTALEGFSVADAARALGIKPETARVRLHRAKSKARQIVQLSLPEVLP